MKIIRNNMTATVDDLMQTNIAKLMVLFTSKHKNARY